jgi:hypothetical protein
MRRPSVCRRMELDPDGQSHIHLAWKFTRTSHTSPSGDSFAQIQIWLTSGGRPRTTSALSASISMLHFKDLPSRRHEFEGTESKEPGLKQGRSETKW